MKNVFGLKTGLNSKILTQTGSSGLEAIVEIIKALKTKHFIYMSTFYSIVLIIAPKIWTRDFLINLLQLHFSFASSSVVDSFKKVPERPHAKCVKPPSANKGAKQSPCVLTVP